MAPYGTSESCCSARIGSLVLGIITSIISGLVVLYNAGLIICAITFRSTSVDYNEYLRQFHRFKHSDTDFVVDKTAAEIIPFIVLICIASIGLIFSLTEFSFSVALAHGAAQRKHPLLMAYLVYGIPKFVIALFFTIVLFVMMPDVLLGSGCLLALGVNAALLAMVYSAYGSIKRFEDYSRLDEVNSFKNVKL